MKGGVGSAPASRFSVGIQVKRTKRNSYEQSVFVEKLTLNVITKLTMFSMLEDSHESLFLFSKNDRACHNFEPLTFIE